MGRPTGLRVISVQDTIILDWDLLELNDLTGYRVYRRTSLENDFNPFALVPNSTNTFKDVGVEFEVAHVYQISAVGDNFESLRSDSVSIVPGPTFSWVADNASRQLIKLTHDSRHEILRAGRFTGMVDLEPNPVTGEVWVLDGISGIEGRLRRVTSAGKIDDRFTLFADPTDASLDYHLNAIWVADQKQGIVARLDSVGNTVLTVDVFSAPTYVSVDQRTGNCWVADVKSNTIARIAVDGTQILDSNVSFSGIKWLAVNSQNGAVWLSDSARVVKTDENGTFLLEITTPLTFPGRLAINENSGDVWVINSDPAAVYKFSSTGETLTEISGFFLLDDISVNLFDNSVLVTEAARSRVHRLSAGGEMLSIFNDFIFPQFVAVQNPR